MIMTAAFLHFRKIERIGRVVRRACVVVATEAHLLVNSSQALRKYFFGLVLAISRHDLPMKSDVLTSGTVARFTADISHFPHLARGFFVRSARNGVPAFMAKPRRVTLEAAIIL